MGTKIISASKLRNNLADALDAVTNDGVLVVTRRGKKPTAIVDLDMLEDLLAASNPEYLESIKTARQQYEKGEILSFEEVFGNI